MEQTYEISAHWGKCFFYSPFSNEPFCWDGNVRVSEGRILAVHLLSYQLVTFAPSVETSQRIFGTSWRSSVRPGAPNGYEGIRFTVSAPLDTHVTITTKSKTVSFPLRRLLDRKRLRWHVGGRYSGVPLEVSLGHDTRYRVYQDDYVKTLQKQRRWGWLIQAEDFSNLPYRYYFSTPTAWLAPNRQVSVEFPLPGYNATSGKGHVKIQAMVAKPPFEEKGVDTWLSFEVSVNSFPPHCVQHLFTMWRAVQKLEDLSFEVPISHLRADRNILTIRNLSSEDELLIHRIYVEERDAEGRGIGGAIPSRQPEEVTLPPSLTSPTLWVGYDLNTTTPQNGEVDEFLAAMARERMGNYVLFRPERHVSSIRHEDWKRWASFCKEHGIGMALCTWGPVHEVQEVEAILREHGGPYFFGVHAHELSGLTYGHLPTDPQRHPERTLVDAKDDYIRGMQGKTTVGQAVPLQHYDYEAGVEYVMSEYPAGHGVLLLAAARGAAKAYSRDIWGAHICCHVHRSPTDLENERMSWLCFYLGWLYGARVLYDEESAIQMFHDAPYAYSDPLPEGRRRIIKDFYHYTTLHPLKGKTVVPVAFLQGNLDCLIGGVQAHTDMPEPTRFWGAFGPETDSWKFGSPEAGWTLLDTFLPGVWLFPVPQNPRKIRRWFTGTPRGQVDLVPINAPPDVLDTYRLLVLPGWNTMTDALYEGLVRYVRNSGHLILAAGQLTTHVTRDWLTTLEDFRLFRGGNVGELGVTLGKPGVALEGIRWIDTPQGDRFKPPPGKLYDVERSSVRALPLRVFQLDPHGARVLATDTRSRAPVLVEYSAGKGRVWLLTVAGYWGHPALQEFGRDLMEMGADAIEGEFSLIGDRQDVQMHVFDEGGGQRRVFLINTDWTKAGNRKRVHLTVGGKVIPLTVRESRVLQVLVGRHVAVNDDPLLRMERIDDTPLGCSLTVRGWGTHTIQFFPFERAPCHVLFEGEDLPFQYDEGTGCVRCRVGCLPQWVEGKLEILI